MSVVRPTAVVSCPNSTSTTRYPAVLPGPTVHVPSTAEASIGDPPPVDVNADPPVIASAAELAVAAQPDSSDPASSSLMKLM